MKARILVVVNRRERAVPVSDPVDEQIESQEAITLTVYISDIVEPSTYTAEDLTLTVSPRNSGLSKGLPMRVYLLLELIVYK